VVQVEVGEGARRKKQTHHNPIFSQVIKSRMAIRLVFHWGPDVDIDRSSGEFDEMFRVWTGLSKYYIEMERRRHSDEIPYEGLVMCPLTRTKDGYTMLHKLCLTSSMRQDDPVYDHGDAYIPSSIQVLHLWCDPDDELPWERTKPTKSRYWHQRIPEWLEGIPYTVIYHGSESESTLKKRRREYLESKYKPKIL